MMPKICSGSCCGVAASQRFLEPQAARVLFPVDDNLRQEALFAEAMNAIQPQEVTGNQNGSFDDDDDVKSCCKIAQQKSMLIQTKEAENDGPDLVFGKGSSNNSDSCYSNGKPNASEDCSTTQKPNAKSCEDCQVVQKNKTGDCCDGKSSFSKFPHVS